MTRQSQEVSSGLQIRKATLAEVLSFIESLEDFTTPPSLDDMEHRASGKAHLALAAELEGSVVGVKFGYEQNPAVFYSWLGGVSPSYRRRGVAKELMVAQEAWVKGQGHERITVKSMNHYPAMLSFLIGPGYQVMGVEGRDEGPDKIKICFSKTLA